MDAVVVSYNSRADLIGLFERRTFTEAFDQVIVIDNGSTDGSQDVAQAAGAKVFTTGANGGFGSAANTGARLTNGPVFALLNPDIRFPSSHIPERIARNFDDPSVGLVGPRLRLPSGELQDSARMVPTPATLVRRRTTGAPVGAITPERSAEVPWLVGACLFVRRATFDEVGGFDERYMLYFEDVDLCVRAQRAGWTVRLDADVEVDHHHRGESRSGALTWATRQHMKSATRFFLTNPEFLFRDKLRRHGRAPAELCVGQP